MTKYFDEEMKKITEILHKTEDINNIVNNMGCVSTMKDEIRDNLSAIRRFLAVYKKTCVELKNLSNMAERANETR